MILSALALLTASFQQNKDSNQSTTSDQSKRYPNTLKSSTMPSANANPVILLAHQTFNLSSPLLQTLGHLFTNPGTLPSYQDCYELRQNYKYALLQLRDAIAATRENAEMSRADREKIICTMGMQMGWLTGIGAAVEGYVRAVEGEDERRKLVEFVGCVLEDWDVYLHEVLEGGLDVQLGNLRIL